MSLIRLNDVSMEFDGRPVLREAFLKLRQGDRIGLIGKNGTGKTTFLELVPFLPMRPMRSPARSFRKASRSTGRPSNSMLTSFRRIRLTEGPCVRRRGCGAGADDANGQLYRATSAASLDAGDRTPTGMHRTPIRRT